VPDPRAAALQGTRALVVDDNARSRKALSYLLETWGIGATEATGGRAALELLLKKSTSGEPFDFVFADLHMPEMDGLELAAHIKSTPPLAGARVVILSAHNHNGIRQRAQHIGVDGL
jgi:CheY-like chemotaxis protein